MKRFFSKLAWVMLLLLVLIACIGLVVISILSTLDSSVADFMQNVTFGQQTSVTKKPVAKAPLPLFTQPDEVKSYNLFTTVEYGSKEVTTGIKYGSTLDQIIKSQWCYLAEATQQQGQTHNTLSLAKIDAKGIKTIPEFKAIALEKFELNKSAVHALIKSHCRFQ